jgi:hypothetical protein
MVVSTVQFTPLTLIRRERRLPLPGRVVVRKGQTVSAAETVAEVGLNQEHRLLDVARALGVSKSKADGYLQCKPGSVVTEGDLLAGPVGLGRRTLRAPADGRVVLAGDGQILLEVKGLLTELKAGFPGEVVELIEDRGVVIETPGALVQGVWGNGQNGFGLLTVALENPASELTLAELDVSQRSSIVLGGHCRDAEVLRMAAETPLRGLILASLSPNLAAVAQRMTLPVLVIEGFGRRPLNSAAFRLLTTNERREVAVLADSWQPLAGVRPEVIIPLPAGAVERPAAGEMTYAVGQTVRLIAAPMAGVTGAIQALVGMTTFPSGVRAAGAEVRLETGDTLTLPLPNLEVIR